MGWNSSKIISPLVSLGCSLSADPNIRGLLQGEHPEFFAQIDPSPVDLSVGDIRSQIAAEWLQCNGHNGEPAIADSLRPPLPQKWGSMCPQDTRMAIIVREYVFYVFLKIQKTKKRDFLRFFEVSCQKT